MKLYKKLIIGTAITISLVLIALFVVYKIGKQKVDLPIDFRNLVKQDNISLTVYYLSPNTRTKYSVNLRNLMNEKYDYKVTVSKSQISDYAASTENKYYELFNKINDMNFLSEKDTSITHGRVHYFFKDGKGRKVLSVTLWSDKGNIIVNGHNIEDSKVFYDIIIPFLPKDAADVLQDYIPK